MNEWLVADKNEELHFTNVLPAHLMPFTIKGAMHKAAVGPFGYILAQQITTQHFSVHYNRYLLNNGHRLHAAGDEPHFEIVFNLGPTVNFYKEGLGNFILHRKEFNVMYVPFVRSVLSFEPERASKIFSIHCSIEHIMPFVKNFPHISGLVQKIENHLPGILYKKNRRLVDELQILIYTILNCKFSGEVLRLYLNAQLDYLMLLCFKDIDDEPDYPAVHLKGVDMERIAEIDEDLLGHLDKHFTIAELALKSGLSKAKLEKGFRLAKGIPLFEYLLEQRMSKARTLLLQTNDLPVSMVAGEVGYADVFGFSKAFKKYYGLSPTEYRKRYYIIKR